MSLMEIGAGLLYSHHFHYQVIPTVIDNEESGGHPDESATETYTRILLKQRIGYPLWMPEPHNLPPEYEALGIRIGDVGIVNENGLFEFSFNICLPANDPINSAFPLPPSFVPFTYTSTQVTRRNGIFLRDTVIVGRSVRERLINPQVLHGRYESRSTYRYIRIADTPEQSSLPVRVGMLNSGGCCTCFAQWRVTDGSQLQLSPSSPRPCSQARLELAGVGIRQS